MSTTTTTAAAANIPATCRTLLQSLPTTNLVLTNHHPTPAPAPNTSELLIRVHTIAPCARELTWPILFPVSTPREPVPVYDVAGTVVSAPASSSFQPGAEVYCRSNYIRGGCARDYAIVKTEEIAYCPKNLTWEQRAATPLSALTAWQGLFVHGGLKPEADANRGKRVLVTAAAGGCGTFFVQLAVWAGAEAIGTASAANHGYLKELGCSEAIDYRTSSVKEWGGEVDLVIDCVGGESLADAWWAVRRGGGGGEDDDGGKLVGIFQPPNEVLPQELRERRVGGLEERGMFFIMVPDGEQLRRITELVEEGVLKTRVDSVWAFEEFEKAWERVDSGRAKGKVVIRVLEE